MEPLGKLVVAKTPAVFLQVEAHGHDALESAVGGDDRIGKGQHRPLGNRPDGVFPDGKVFIPDGGLEI